MDEGLDNATTLSRGTRMSAKLKRDAVLRIIRGEDLETVSRDVGVIAARLSRWRDAFLAAGESVLKHRPGDGRDEKITRLEAKFGQILLDNELLRDKIARMKAGRPLVRPMPKR